MRQYGIGYQGSKSQIAEEIIGHLPAGKCLVDLFGGGFAISHCGLLSGKYERILYNDINPLLPILIQDAIDGKYNYERFIPEWIDRETFFRKKDSDGYVRFCWSFSCNGHDYLFGKDVEEMKKAGHEWIFFGKPIPGFDDIKCDLPCEPQYFSARRKELALYAKKQKETRCKMQHLEQIERVQRLEHIEHIQRMQQIERIQRVQQIEQVKRTQLELRCMDYRDYKYEDGDVVYCDIPYPNSVDLRVTKNYQTAFDHGAFYQWAISRPYPVYFSVISWAGSSGKATSM